MPEACRVFYKIKFGKFVRLVGFIKKKFVTAHGHMNVKLATPLAQADSLLTVRMFCIVQHDIKSTAHCDHNV
jgi:hypothetical protein